MVISKMKYLVVFVVISVVVGVSTSRVDAFGQKNTDIFAAASDAIDVKEFDAALEKLGKIKSQGLSDSDLGWWNFLEGKAKYLKTAKDIRSCIDEGSQEAGKIKDQQAQSLREALDHFLIAYDKAPDSVWAPEALYAAALVQDYGCLQRFEEAAELYKKVYEKYPDTHLGLRAQERYNILKAGFDGKGHTTVH